MGKLAEIDEEMTLSALAEAYADGNVPSIWTPSHVERRLVEAFDVLSRSPARIGPSAGGNAWPPIFRDFAELIDADKMDAALATGQNRTAQIMLEMFEDEAQSILRREADADLSRAARIPTSAETSRADEALNWGLEHLQDAPLQSHALHLWALCKACNLKAAPLLRKRAVRADGMIGYRNEGRRREIARKWADWANGWLVGETDPWRVAAVKSEATSAARAELAALPRIRRQDVMPDRVFNRNWLDFNRHRGAAILARKLANSHVQVR